MRLHPWLAVAIAISCFMIGWCMRGFRSNPLASGTELAAEPELGATRETAEPEPSLVELTASRNGQAPIEREPVASSTNSDDLSPTVLDAMTILDQALERHPVYSGNDSVFMEKYAGASSEHLLIALSALELKHKAEAKRITDELIANGRQEVHRLREGDPGPSFSTSRDRPIVSFAFSCEHDGDVNVVRTTVIDPAEFPEFGALETEVWWLGTHVRHLGLLQH